MPAVLDRSPLTGRRGRGSERSGSCDPAGLLADIIDARHTQRRRGYS